MEWTTDIRDFITEHQDDDTATLMLASHRYPAIDVTFAVEQIESRKKMKTKLPEWWANKELIMGGRVPSEQCSSEQTARYKRQVIATLPDGSQPKSLCDMTGGMGVDFYYMSEGIDTAIYTERQEMLCENASHNFKELGRQAVVRQGDGRDLPVPDVDVIYLDPARRAHDGSRVYAIEDCEPNIIEWQDELLSHSRMVLVKLSPMVDITDALRKLKGVSEVHVVAVKNECKEVLVKMLSDVSVADSDISSIDDVSFHCIDFLSDKTLSFVFSKTEKEDSAIQVAEPSLYLYEPDVTIMKSQGFKPLCSQYSVCQLDYDTRLMTSPSLISDFPGRIFHIDEVIPFSSKTLKRLKSLVPKANIATRNFPLSADELRQRTGIKDGGTVYLFGAHSANLGYVLLKCSKV